MKYLSMCLCIVLLITSLIFSPIDNAVKMGEGDGENKELSNVNEVVDFLMFMGGDESYSDLCLDDMNIARITLSTESMPFAAEGMDEADTEPAFKRDVTTYRSGTIHQYTYQTQTYSVYKEGEGRKYYSVTFDRNLSLYITDDASYYHSKGSYSRTNDDENMYFSFDMEFYFSDENVFVKFNEFDYMGDSKDIGFELLDEGYGVWLDFTDERWAALDVTNREDLSEIGQELSDTDEEDFDINGNIYTIEEFDDDSSSKFEINLNDAERPSISFVSSDNSSSESYTNNSKIVFDFYFENIDNTVVEFDEDIDVKKNLKKYVKIYE